MASEQAYSPAPPPSPRLPPPPPSPHPTHLQAPQISPRRFAVQPPLLNTTLAPPPPSGPAYLHGSTPVTASSLSLPFSPSLTPSTYAPSPVAAASPMAMRGSAPAAPYNPQQWSRGGSVNGQHVQHSQISVPSRLHDVTGMEGTRNFSLSSLLPRLCSRFRRPAFLLSQVCNKSCVEHIMALCTPSSPPRQSTRHIKMGDANTTSLDALPATSIFAWSEPKHLAVTEHQHHFVATAHCQYVSPPSAAPAADQQSAIGASHLRLPQSAYLHCHTLERHKCDIEPAVSPSTGKERYRSVGVARQTDFQVQPFVL